MDGSFLGQIDSFGNVVPSKRCATQHGQNKGSHGRQMPSFTSSNEVDEMLDMHGAALEEDPVQRLLQLQPDRYNNRYARFSCDMSSSENPARWSPTTFIPTGVTSNPEYKKYGGTSAFTRVFPPIMASDPIFENW